MSKKLKFQSPTGMHDILLEEQKYFQKIYEVCEDIANFYQFQKIETPILEETELFSRGIGFSTDIVGKQMFTLRTKGGDYLTLRPEFTASIVRAYIEHGMFNLPQPVKLWYFGPCFRYEHPQAGRFRQFWQFGFEVLGEESPVIDTQVIQIFYNILREIRLKKLIIEINSIGDNQCRPYYKKLLVSYFRSREMALCADCRRRLRENPLRILDCKEEKCQRIISQAPQMIDHLCESCHSHFKEVLEFLDEIGLPYHLNPYLVRGLDYYTKTVFEIYEESPEGRALGALAGGGRYDALTKLLGGKDTPGCGGAGGIERIINLMKTRQLRLKKEREPEIFLAQLGNLGKRKSLRLLEDFRKAKIQIAESFGRDSLKAQLARADKLGVKHTLILGQQEALEGTIIVRDMASGKQETIKIEKVVREMKRRI
ncbi:MAG: histidine--tRNA ligase [Candidatus Nealsonbacteria bacterium CG01_land_8_20_14_3_00_12]|uniref:Histidine--tRNA ligase n=2 Tax=Candidatus Nealsoniibacteriota TaxID=1817911 RepID=A0A2M7EC36_9BACT|nr:MAG: histidine--tRNA ligase [Candidatus Nealsonbacteria bacterium CG01_land_8_20_14_3_00_12]PJA83733.1 MAG: histidine--tRNA ligase [Candidatus Nealsonbacteria bacterium CG_4_9_14_3_um_filter_37_29]